MLLRHYNIGTAI